MPSPTYWIVRATGPGAALFLQHDVVAVNFQTRYDVTGARADAMVADDRHTEEWDKASVGQRTSWARSLAQFSGASDRPDRPSLARDDVVVATSGSARPALVGTVVGAYEYRPELSPHPHTRSVRWGGSVTYAELADAGAPVPGISVPALGPLATTSAARALLDAAAVAPRTAADARPRSRRTVGGSQQAPPTHPLEIPSPPPIFDRGPAPAWTPPEDDAALVVPCEKPSNRCARHTHYRHLYRAEPARLDEAGHDLLVIAFNPNCPDDTSSDTFRYIAELADELGTRGITVTNLVPRRCVRPGLLDLRDVPDDRWAANRAVLERAIADATVVVVGWGQGKVPGHSRGLFDRERAGVVSKLRDAHKSRGLPITQFGDRAVHPSKWKQHTARTEGRYRPWLVPLDG